MDLDVLATLAALACHGAVVPLGEDERRVDLMGFKSRICVVAVLLSLAMAPAGAGPGSPTSSAAPPPPSFSEQLERVTTAAEEAFVAESTAGRIRSVPSPFTVLDRVGEPRPYNNGRGDITVFQTRNGPGYVDFQFRLVRRPDTWNTATTGAVIRIDLAGTGPAIDYDAVVVSTPRTGKVVVVGPHPIQTDEVTCASRNVSDLSPNRFGYGYSARFNFACMGGHRGFRTRMAFLYSRFPNDPLPSLDFAPNTSLTPVIQPR